MADTEPRFRTTINPEMTRRAELRTNFLVPIYVMWSSDVPSKEAQAATQGVYDALSASGQKRDVINLGAKAWSKGDYSSADWYLDKALQTQSEARNKGHGQQINVYNLKSQFVEEPWQENPHWEVFIVNKDLYMNDTSFVFGATDPYFASSVQSVRRLIDEVPETESRLEMVRRLLRHEVGHMFGLPGRNFNVEEKLGPHCTNVCTMRQGMDIREWAKLTQEEDRGKVHFCKDCMNILAQKRNQYKPLPR
jgi:predicted Zn-dependent protease